MDRHAVVYVAAGNTLVGAGLRRVLRARGFEHVIEAEPDLADADAVQEFYARTRPETVILPSWKIGGIAANQRCPADLLRDNLLAQCNVMHGAYTFGVRKLLYLASSCCYPRVAPQPMRVECLLSGPLEPSSEGYGMAKLAGIGMVRAYRQQHGSPFICAIPATPFGPEDDFFSDDAHVVAGLLRRTHEARLRGADAVDVWGSGRPLRDFIYVDDLADACLFLLDRYDDAQPINLASADGPLSIRHLAETVRAVVGFDGVLRFDTSRPDGAILKTLDAEPLRALGWRAATPLHAAMQATYAAFRAQAAAMRAVA